MPMFQTAGKNTAIKVSNESLSKVNRLFYDDLDGDELGVRLKEVSRPDPLMSSSLTANVDSSSLSPCFDRSILKQNPYRSRNSNKVRFSLDPLPLSSHQIGDYHIHRKKMLCKVAR
jgi:hypothetical protein